MADFAGFAHFHSIYRLIGMGVFCFRERFHIIRVAVQAFLGIADRDGSLQVGVDLGPVQLTIGQFKRINGHGRGIAGKRKCTGQK